MSFGQPLWFWAMTLLPLLLALHLRHERRRVKLLRQLVAARLLDRLAGTVSLGRRRFRFFLLLLALAALIVSLAEPRYGYTWEESKRKGRDIIIAIDCSKSMLSTDLSPNRLERAKLAVQDLIGQLQGDRVGLIAFAGTSFLQAPLTIDYGAILNSLSEFDTNIIPRGGTNIASAITEADAAFGKGESDNRCLILFTDGEELEADAVAAANAEKGNMKIFTVGLGSADGSLIPVPDEHGGTTFVKDENGQIVKSRLDEDRLRKIAESTGGFYVHLLNGPAEMQQIVREGLGQMKEKDIDTRMSRRPIERYEWPLSAALILLVASTLIGERKRASVRRILPQAARVAALLVVMVPLAARAKNSGLEDYEREDYKGAVSEFDRQLQQQRDSAALNFDLGAAAYKSGDFPTALEAFSKATTSPDPSLHSAAEYNLGNTLFEQGVALPEKDKKIRELKDALAHYDQALKIAPQNKDAQYNRDVVLKLLEDLQKEPPKSDQKQQQQQDKKDDQKDKKNQQNQQQQQQKSKGGQNDQDQQNQSQQNQSQQQQQQNQSQNQQSQQQQQSQGQQSQQQQQSQGQQSKPQQAQNSQGQPPQNQQQGGSQQEKQQSSNGQEGKEGQQNAQQQQQPKDGNGNERKEANAKQTQGDQQMPQPRNDGQGEPLKPMTGEADKKREGQIQAQNAQPADAQKEAAAEAEAAKEGKMTEQQARTLLESLKDEDEHVQLLKPPGKPLGRNFRDW